jgi:predicted kinase
MARDVVMVNGLPGSGKSSPAPRLAARLGAACLGKDRIKEALAETINIRALGDQVRAALWTS